MGEEHNRCILSSIIYGYEELEGDWIPDTYQYDRPVLHVKRTHDCCFAASSATKNDGKPAVELVDFSRVAVTRKLSVLIQISIILALSTSFYTSRLFAKQEAYEVSAMSSKKAFEIGRLFRSQYKNIESRQYLRHAADNDNAEASYLYAMELSNYKTTIRTPPEAQKYLLKSAELGNRRAMYHLYTDATWLRDLDIQHWKKQYFESLIQSGSKDPSQTMYELARFYKNTDREMYVYYLDKAIGFNHPRALMDKAENIHSGEGLYLMPGGRSTVVDGLYLAAAETEYIPAIRYYIDILEQKGKFEDAYKWRLIALEKGDITSLATVSKILLGRISTYSFVPQDHVKAKAYLDLYLSSAGNERMGSLYSVLSLDEENITAKMTEKEKLQSREIYIRYKHEPDFYNHDVFWDAN